MTIDIELIKSVDEIRANPQPYQQLLTTCSNADIEYQHHLNYIFHTVDSEENSELILIILKQNNEPLLAALFTISKSNYPLELGLLTLGKPKIKYLKLLGHKFIHKNDINVDVLYPLVFEKLEECSEMFDIAEIYVDSKSSMAVFLSNHSRLNNWYCKKFDEDQRYIIKLAETFESYLKNLPSHLRRELKRRYKKVQESKKVQLIKVSNEKGLDYFYTEMMKIYHDSWKKNYIVLPSLNDLVLIAKLGILRSYLLVVNEEAIAFTYGIQPGKETYMGIETGYKNSWIRYSPGKILHYLLIKDLHEYDKPLTMDLGEGKNQYKVDFSNKIATTIHFVIYTPKTRGALLLAIQKKLNKINRLINNFLKMIKMDNFIRSILKNKK